MKTVNLNNNKGFTLIELMVTVLLGAIISAAVIQVFITSQRVDRLQTSGSEIQDKSIFAMQAIEKQIRLANLGNDVIEINSLSPKGGVVFTAISHDQEGDTTLTDAQRKANIVTGNELPAGYLSRSGSMPQGGSNSWTGVSNMKGSSSDIPSDQLTIQYTNVVNEVDMYDCEGTMLNNNERVVERYFLKSEDDTINLHCDAGRIEEVVNVGTNGSTDITYTSSGLGSSTVIMENVDQFNIRLGVERRTVQRGRTMLEKADVSVEDYMALTGSRPLVNNIRISILTRSSANSPEGSPDSFTIFGETQTLKDNSKKFMRRLYESNIVIRNARILDL